MHEAQPAVRGAEPAVVLQFQRGLRARALEIARAHGSGARAHIDQGSAHTTPPLHHAILRSQHERAGLLGNFLSHASVYARFAATPVGASAAPQLLLLEDDVEVAPRFFAALPCLLEQLGGRAFDVVRFGCWGAYCASDAVGSSAYLARPHSFNRTGMAYGGAHATLVPFEAARRVVDRLRAFGVMPIDAALREGLGDRQGLPHHVHAGLRSYVINTPLARTGGFELSETWRADHGGGAAAPAATDRGGGACWRTDEFEGGFAIMPCAGRHRERTCT